MPNISARGHWKSSSHDHTGLLLGFNFDKFSKDHPLTTHMSVFYHTLLIKISNKIESRVESLSTVNSTVVKLHSSYYEQKRSSKLTKDLSVGHVDLSHYGNQYIPTLSKKWPLFQRRNIKINSLFARTWSRQGHNRELKPADGNRKWAVFTFNLLSHNHIHIAKYLFSIRDE